MDYSDSQYAPASELCVWPFQCEIIARLYLTLLHQRFHPHLCYSLWICYFGLSCTAQSVWTLLPCVRPSHK